MSKHFNAGVRFVYVESENKTHLLLRFPGEKWYTEISCKEGTVTTEEAETIMRAVATHLKKELGAADIVITKNPINFPDFGNDQDNSFM